MMIVQMDKMSSPSSRERAQRLYEKNIELENKRHKSGQARIPSDPNAWQQIRENYEAIVLEDHGFSEQHNIEYALWQLHYKRIEELRAHFTAALASSGSNTSQGAKVPARPDRIAKIRLQFKTFLSEATGFYHDLILKIRSKYGLPLGYVSEDSDNRVVLEKDGKKMSDMKKGLISCHRCLIYLGDLARYKGLYGDSDSKAREHAAASSYYLQAASLWPSNGNPHHQLAILASYSGDELVTVYRYFRSLAVDNPFSTARDNLIVAFEKNRQSYAQLTGETKVPIVKDSFVRVNNKGRGKWEAKPAIKDSNSEANVINGKTSSIQDMYKNFCICFVRLNGILFTRTSLETFADVLSSVSSEFCELLSSGPEEELNFGADVADNTLFIVRLISILVFTVHNVKKEGDGQTYAEIVQRAVLLQNSFAAVFDLMGHIMERFVQLRDPSSSYLLPGILVFMEWLACCPDVASGSDADEKQAAVRLSFWNHCTSFLNKILSFWSKSLDDDEDDTCFYKMTQYEEGETGNRLALWEDFELRGFLPLFPAQTVLDFSRKPFGSDGSKEKVARVKRILAAGKALANVARIDQKTIFYDSRTKKFVIGVAPQIPDDGLLSFDSGLPKTNDVLQEIQPEKTVNVEVLQPNLHSYVEGDEEDEVIVFRPAVPEKRNDIPSWAPCEGMKLNQEVLSTGGMKFYNGSISAPFDVRQQAIIDAGFQKSLFSDVKAPQQLQTVQPNSPKWLMEEAASLANSLKAVRFMENGYAMERDLPRDLGMAHIPAHSMPIHHPATMNSSSLFYSHTKTPESLTPSEDVIASSGIVTESFPVKMSAAAVASRKSPVSRPVRHLGPPPGFTHVPPKSVNEPGPGSDLVNENSLADDYSWLDGYQLPSSTKGSVLNCANITSQVMPQYVNNSNGFTGAVSFPFPGKQVPPVSFQTEKQRGWQNYQALELIRLQQEQQMQQQLFNGNQQFTPMPEQYHGKSIWGGRYIV